MPIHCSAVPRYARHANMSTDDKDKRGQFGAQPFSLVSILEKLLLATRCFIFNATDLGLFFKWEAREGGLGRDVTRTSKMTLLRAIIYIISVLRLACRAIDFMSAASPICVR